jgi:hypothetical protein
VKWRDYRLFQGSRDANLSASFVSDSSPYKINIITSGPFFYFQIAEEEKTTVRVFISTTQLLLSAIISCRRVTSSWYHETTLDDNMTRCTSQFEELNWNRYTAVGKNARNTAVDRFRKFTEQVPRVSVLDIYFTGQLVIVPALWEKKLKLFFNTINSKIYKLINYKSNYES